MNFVLTIISQAFHSLIILAFAFTASETGTAPDVRGTGPVPRKLNAEAALSVIFSGNFHVGNELKLTVH